VELTPFLFSSLKEFFQDEIIQNSKFKSFFEEIDYDNIE